MSSTAEEIASQVNALLGQGHRPHGERPEGFKVEYYQTGVLPLDVLLGGGIPKGITEFYGDFSTLKSYVALKTFAVAQSQGGTCVLIDTEHSFDPEWAESLGVDIEKLIVQHPETGEIAVDVTETFVRAGVDLIVWDSIAATLPSAEQEKRATEAVQPARLAALMSRAMRKLTAANTNTALICINQTREKVGSSSAVARRYRAVRLFPSMPHTVSQCVRRGRSLKRSSLTMVRSGTRPSWLRAIASAPRLRRASCPPQSGSHIHIRPAPQWCRRGEVRRRLRLGAWAS